MKFLLKRAALAIMQSSAYGFVVRRVLPKIRFSTQYGGLSGAEYHSCKSVCMPGDMIFAKDPWKLSQMLVPGEFSHVGLCASNPSCLPGRVIEMTVDGFGQTSLYDMCRKHRRITIGRCADWNEDYIEDVIDAAMTYRDVDYDILFKSGVKDLYCSELIYYSDFERRLDVTLSDIFVLDRQYVSPTGLAEANNVEIVWDSRT